MLKGFQDDRLPTANIWNWPPSKGFLPITRYLCPQSTNQNYHIAIPRVNDYIGDKARQNTTFNDSSLLYRLRQTKKPHHFQ